MKASPPPTDVPIPRVMGLVRLGRVPVPHTNDATYVLDRTGRRWVAKREAEMGCEALLAEALTWLLARRIGVPVPDAGWSEDESGRTWLSAWVPNAKHWAAVAAGVLTNREQAAAILTLDAVVFNEARHGGNLLLVPEEGGGSRIVAIDGDEALIGHPAELARRGFVPPEPRILARGFPPPGWRADALAAASRCAAIPADVLARDAANACRVAREPAVDEVARVLVERSARAVRLTEEYLSLVEARS
jgi:hypothetical protein